MGSGMSFQLTGAPGLPPPDTSSNDSSVSSSDSATCGTSVLSTLQTYAPHEAGLTS